MSTPIDPDLERRVLAAIREPLVAAVAGADDRTGAARARTQRLVAAVCACVLIAGGAVAIWRSSRGGDTAPQIRVGPTTTAPSPTTTPRAITVECDGTALSLSGSGAVPGADAFAWYLDLQNDTSTACYVPFPTVASAIDASDQRVGLSGIDHIAGPGPIVEPGDAIRLVLATTAACAQSGQRFRHLVVTVGGQPFSAPLVELRLCDQGVVAVRLETPPAPSASSDPTAVAAGVSGTSIIHLRNVPLDIGSGIGNGVAESADGRFIAYEYGDRTVHEVATVAVDSCDRGCTETVLGHGHSPVYSSDGRLAYVALDSQPPVGEAEAVWKRIGSVTVRAPDGTTQTWARGRGLQTLAWAGKTLLVAHDVPSAQSEGFEELWLYRGPNDRTILGQGLVAISPDGARLLLTANGADQMLELYDVASQRVVSSISVADYQRELAPAPMSCCERFTGASLWHDDLVLLPMTHHLGSQSNGEPELQELRPTLLRVVGDRIVPLRTLRISGYTNDYDAARWLPGSNTEFAFKRSDVTPPVLVRCRIEGPRADCNEDPSVETAFRRPAVP